MTFLSFSRESPYLEKGSLYWNRACAPLYNKWFEFELQELNQRAQGEVTIREALRELDLWGAGAVFALTEYEDSNKHQMMLIKDWKDLVNQVSVKSTYRSCMAMEMSSRSTDKKC